MQHTLRRCLGMARFSLTRLQPRPMVAASGTLAARLGVLAHTVAGVDHDGLLDDQTILDQLADVLTCSGKRLR